jgi:hypothetical protein
MGGSIISIVRNNCHLTTFIMSQDIGICGHGFFLMLTGQGEAGREGGKGGSCTGTRNEAGEWIGRDQLKSSQWRKTKVEHFKR